MLDQGRAAFDPVAVVAVEDALDRAHLGGVNVAAHHAVGAPPSRLGDDGGLEAADVFDRLLDLVLEVGRQRPVAEPQLAPDPVDGGVDGKRRLVGPVADEGQPTGVAHHAVELVAVQDQQAASIGGDMDGLVLDDDAPEAAEGEVAEILVVVAGDVDDTGPLAGLTQQFLDDVVVGLVPIPGAPEAPAVEDVADQIEEVGVRYLEEIEKQLGIAATGTQMDIRNPDGAVAPGQGSDGVQRGPIQLRCSNRQHLVV